jgi:tellurium resistance protein TerD
MNTIPAVINLSKGERINLNKSSPSLKRARIGLGWNPSMSDTNSKFDLDVSAFVLKSENGNPKAIGVPYFVFYNNLKTPDGSVVHTGDNRTGDGDGDDETIIVDLAKLPAEAIEVSFVVTIDDAAARRQNFGQVKNSYIRIYNDETGELISEYQLRDEASSATAVQFGSLERNSKGEFIFSAIGEGFTRGLSDFVTAYGLQ